MSGLITDPNHESPDVIDQRSNDDPTLNGGRPGDPSVTPGILLPTTVPPGWTIAADGSMQPLDDAPPAPEQPIVLPEMTITGTPPSSSSSMVPALMIGLGLAMAVAAARARR